MSYVNFFLEWPAGLKPDGTPLMAKVGWPWFTLAGTMVTLSVAWAVRTLMLKKPSSLQNNET
jgi:hypothetical protein